MTDEKRLTGRAALVTGVSRRQGIGFAIAEQLVVLGADVFIQAFSPFDAAQAWGADPGGIGAIVTALGRHGTQIAHGENARDAARLIGWLATDDARWITGQVINSTGGGM